MQLLQTNSEAMALQIILKFPVTGQKALLELHCKTTNTTSIS